MTFIAPLQQRARTLKAETLALHLAARHPATPWYAKVLVSAGFRPVGRRRPDGPRSRIAAAVIVSIRSVLVMLAMLGTLWFYRALMAARR